MPLVANGLLPTGALVTNCAVVTVVDETVGLIIAESAQTQHKTTIYKQSTCSIFQLNKLIYIYISVSATSKVIISCQAK